MRIKKTTGSWLHRKSRLGFRGYPIGTVAFYGPTAEFASKVVASIVSGEDRDPDHLERWFSEETDVRYDRAIGEQISDFLKTHGALSVVVADAIIGCPHEEGIDYPEGQSCPRCPWWAGRDRFTGERIQ